MAVPRQALQRLRVRVDRHARVERRPHATEAVPLRRRAVRVLVERRALFVRHRKRHSSKSLAASLTAWTAFFRTSRRCSALIGLKQHARNFHVSQQLGPAAVARVSRRLAAAAVSSRPSGAQTPPRESATARSATRRTCSRSRRLRPRPRAAGGEQRGAGGRRRRRSGGRHDRRGGGRRVARGWFMEDRVVRRGRHQHGSREHCSTN